MTTTDHPMSDTYAPLPTVNARISPRGGLDILSRAEIARLTDATQGSGLSETLRRCALAVLTVGSDSDDPRAASARYPDFQIEVQQMDRGIRLELKNAPALAFVDGELIRGVADLLFAVVRDIAYTAIEVQSGQFDFETSEGLTSAVFEILRNARAMRPHQDPNLVVCWGGHSIGREEYLYTKKVGYELGLRGLDICTGCGPGAMKGPMKGATIAHAKQRQRNPRYIGMTEPGIIAAESPNPIVNQLVIMPDIEKRLEGFVRLGHGIIVFPGGVGTAEEILYLLGILLHPDNAGVPFPLVFTGPNAEDPVRIPAALRTRPRRDVRPRPALRPSGARTRRRPAPRLLRHRRRQREGAGHAPHRAARPVRDPRRQGHHGQPRRPAARLRRAAPHEDVGRIQALLPRRGLRRRGLAGTLV